MGKLWAYIVLVLLIQEPASTDAGLFQARQHHLNVWLIHLIWLACTAIDIYVGYKLGQWVKEKFKNKKFEITLNGWVDKVQNFIGRKGEEFVLILLGLINFPYLDAFLGPWLKINFKKIFILVFIGDALWYAIEWGINLGLRRLVPDPHLALYIIIGVGLILGVAYKIVLTKLLNKKNRD